MIRSWDFTATGRILREQLKRLVVARTGPLTTELVREPAKFGLGQLPVHVLPDALTTSVCGFCSTGCGLDLHLRDREAVGLSPSRSYPVNTGMACPKGWEALAPLTADDRATVPLVKGEHGRRRAVSWDEAIRTMVERIKRLQHQYGRECVAFLSTGQIPSEEMALLGAVAKFGMGLRHGDGNTRQCMATAVVAYKEAFGFDAPPYTYEDFEQSDCLIFIGANPCIAHPVLWQRVLRNPHRPQIITVDPRYTETAASSTLHLPLKPKSDLHLLYGLARILIEKDWIDREFLEAHTSGFDEFTAFVQQYGLPLVSEATGLSPSMLLDTAARIHSSERVSLWWTMGVNQSYQGVRTAQAIINLALITGNIGRPGTGANSITGQCNAMGSRLFSNTTNLLGGHDFSQPEHRSKIANLLGISPDRIPDQPSWAYHEILEGVLRGQIKGLWVIGTNPAHSWINQHQLHDILSRLELLVVQDMYHSTETAQLANILLPAAGWGEKEGTFINSERRIGLIKKVRPAPGQALSDFNIFKLVAHHYGVGTLFEQWRCPEDVFQILQQCTAEQPCDIRGICGYAHLDAVGGVQWPYPPGETSTATHRRLFEDGRFYRADGRARLVWETPRPLTEPPTAQYPFLLLTGRGSAAQWHTQTRTRKSPVLRKLAPESLYVEINPQDARQLKIQPEQWVVIQSQRGQLRAKAFVTHSVQPGQIFLPMHDSATNRLTHAMFDPYSKQPSYKACAVRIRREEQVE